MLLVGTDASGIDSPIEALKNMKIPFKYIFASEIDQKLRQYIIRENKPLYVSHDMSKRIHTDLPKIDLYISGIPCQSHSTLGNGRGLQCINGKLLFSAIETIKATEPKFFIIENVKGLLKCGIKELFEELNYTMYYEIINSIYFVPQNRNRLYIIGVKKNLNKTYNFNTYNRSKKYNIDDILDEHINLKCLLPINKLNILNEIKIKKNILSTDNYVINLGCSNINYASSFKDASPTLLTSCYNYWLTKYNRNLTINELAKLQGLENINMDFLSHTSKCKAIGNSMTSQVIEYLIKVLLHN